MPSVTNMTGDDYNLPGLGGLVVPAHETVPVTEEQWAELVDHPFLIVTPAPVEGVEPAPPAVPEPELVTAPADMPEGE